MDAFRVLCALTALVACDAGYSPHALVPTTSLYHAQDELGQYSFGYSGGPSSRSESRDAYGNVRGSFSYVDPYGVVQSQRYVADDYGFRVQGTNLPSVRHKRSYGTSPAATGPLTVHHAPVVHATPALTPVIHAAPAITPIVHAAPVAHLVAPVAHASPIGGFSYGFHSVPSATTFRRTLSFPVARSDY